MPFALLLIAIMLLAAGLRGHDAQTRLFDTLKDDFTGDKSFFMWVLAIIIIVAIGNVKALRPVSNAFLGLVIIVIILQNGKRGLFDNFLSQVHEGTSGNSGGGGGGILGALTPKQLSAKTATELGIHFF